MRLDIKETRKSIQTNAMATHTTENLYIDIVSVLHLLVSLIDIFVHAWEGGKLQMQLLAND